ncbi:MULTISPECIES: SIMPL domain-containing protein [unclassified Bradyrhizobium]|uniref:SIMPL domain-containing protein n=1 Tax=unclassified Bradyrhizobium TaxID=2631580 RepID=UPI0004036A42|nr:MULTISPECIES: SIMPL domain-containing protein [unclassified Bradyrhizobium]QIG96407.1 SIMPL domain-containing protein [Bradyrhizobium sp. 6(2017)]
MKLTLPLASLALSLIAAPALAQVPPPAISVTGEATVSVAPDQAVIDGGVTTDAKTAREAADANNTAMAKVLGALKGAGLDEKDYQTSRLSLQPKHTPDRVSGPPTVSGYRATNRVTIKVRDVAKVASLVDVLVGAGVNEIGGINFVVSQASKVLDEAREKAIADARRKAEIYAKAAGVTLGEPISISEEGNAPVPMYRKMAAPMAASSAPVAQGEETLSVSVSVSWAIKGK